MYQRNPHLLSSLITAHLSLAGEQESCCEGAWLRPLTAMFADLLKRVAFASYVDLLLESFAHLLSFLSLFMSLRR